MDKKALRRHEYKIWKGKNERWYTYLPEGEGRRLVSKKYKKDIEETIIDFYSGELDSAKSVDKVYWEWRKYHDQMVCDNTVVKYETEYRRFFEDEKFMKKRIGDVTEDEVTVFIKNKTVDLGLPKKATKTLFGHLANTFLFAERHRYIEKTPMSYLHAADFYKWCEKSRRSQRKQTYDDHEIALLNDRLQQDHRDHPEYIPSYAVELASLTGMRVSELTALKWDCIFDDYILIDKSEKYNRLTGAYEIGKTKNYMERKFPMTPEIKKVLDAVKAAEIANGYFCEWVFADANGRIKNTNVSSCIKNKCRQVGIEERGIHCYRKTVNSKMRCAGTSSTVAAALLGHSPIVNQQYYTFDVSNIDDKRVIISSVNKQMILKCDD